MWVCLNGKCAAKLEHNAGRLVWFIFLKVVCKNYCFVYSFDWADWSGVWPGGGGEVEHTQYSREGAGRRGGGAAAIRPGIEMLKAVTSRFDQICRIGEDVITIKRPQVQ